MTQEDYKKLNDYLNGCFQKLERTHFFFLRNIELFCEMSETYVHILNKYELKSELPKENNLTFEEVFMLAREIIEDINPLYLTEYDKIISTGVLDFSFESKYHDSHYAYLSKQKTELININRTFNYQDVTTLVHEYMHKISLNLKNKKETSTSRVLTEFISIYFEEYAKRYLLAKGISKEELFFNERIISTKNYAATFNWYGLILLVYEKIGKIDENSYLFLNENYLPITKEKFEEECKATVDKIKKIEKQYEQDIMYEKNYDENELYNRCLKFINIPYKYIFGTLLTYYALENVDKEIMVWLSEHVADENQTVLDILSEIGIELDEIPIIELVQNMANNINIKSKKIR